MSDMSLGLVVSVSSTCIISCSLVLSSMLIVSFSTCIISLLSMSMSISMVSSRVTTFGWEKTSSGKSNSYELVGKVVLGSGSRLSSLSGE